MKKQFEKFLETSWGLEIWSGDKIVFQSKKEGIGGLVDFIKENDNKYKDIIIFDKIVGQGVALLAAFLNAQALYGKIGSKLAAETLEKFKIRYYFQKTVPNILNKEKTDLCPLEKLSFSKTPEEFYQSLN